MAWDDFMPQVCRGQRGGRRLSGTGETHVVWLITQRRQLLNAALGHSRTLLRPPGQSGKDGASAAETRWGTVFALRLATAVHG